MMEKSIPEMHVIIPPGNWTEMVKKAQVNDMNLLQDYEVKGTLKFIYEGEEEEEYNIKFKLGGMSSAVLTKPGYNIKIIGNYTLHGTKNFKLRSDQRDPSMMRSKITTDILQKSGLLATEAGYTELYVNEEYMGFWVVTDSLKKNWVQRKFGINEDNVSTLYKCDYFRFEKSYKCENAGDDRYAENWDPIWILVQHVRESKSIEDLEEMMDVENFIKYMAWEWLMGTWDHFLGIFNHNLNWLQRPDGKWIYIPNDHDIELGEEIHAKFYPEKPFVDEINDTDIDYANIPIEDFENNHPIMQILVHQDDTIFRRCVGDIISKVFNPDTLFPQIDKIRKLIGPYVKKDRELKGGYINKKGKNIVYTYDHFLLNTEYTYIRNNVDTWYKSYGLKDWIRRRYNFAAKYYGINTDATNPKEKHKLIEPRPEAVRLSTEVKVTYEETDDPNYTIIKFDNPLPEYTPDPDYADDSIPTIGASKFLLDPFESFASIVASMNANPSAYITTTTTNGEATPVTVTVTADPVTVTVAAETVTVTVTSCPDAVTSNIEATATSTITEPTQSPDENEECWSENLGYKCCTKKCDAIFVLTDELGNWGMENKEWCGIPKNCKFNNECSASKFGYPCCKGCTVYEKDEVGEWGYENDEWCSIKATCSKN
ncbi:hypothetical protein LY90DRAFT_383447 [Neocallimastix californiae]|uniref:CBM10 domain-containing protein n=1 Tax=Neocallimastix californiae TaxID=1754190 RepID=A0A1Y2D255_9FUNG|nr:hypothetical protein LY90DRAFT_383447 [Neocallimastix californiae]|eukprot:ORY53371.1 hypothetical protein LY90DRAFT_383447 [Neocallimastix californiae]